MTGAVAAAALAAAGAEVTLVARSRPEIEAWAARLAAQGGAAEATALELDSGTQSPPAPGTPGYAKARGEQGDKSADG